MILLEIIFEAVTAAPFLTLSRPVCILQDHCWNYIQRNWHLLQRTPTYKVSLPLDQRQRLATDVKESLSQITTLDSPGDQSQSMGFSVLWDASNTQPDKNAANALTPDGKRPVSKATEKRRQRLAEEQEQRRQEEERRMLQQRRQQTVKEIRQRQAAAAAQTKGSDKPSASMTTASENAGTAESSSNGSDPLQQASQGRAGLRATSSELPQQRAGLRANSQQAAHHRASTGANNQRGAGQGAGLNANGRPGLQPRSGLRADSQQAAHQSARPKTGPRADGQQAAQSRAHSQASYLRAGQRAAAPQGRQQNTGQIADKQPEPSPAAGRSLQKTVSEANSRSGSSRLQQKAATEQPVGQSAAPSRSGLRAGQEQQQPAGSRSDRQASASASQADWLEANNMMELKTPGSQTRQRADSDSNGQSRPESEQAVGRQSLQQLRRLSLARGS